MPRVRKASAFKLSRPSSVWTASVILERSVTGVSGERLGTVCDCGILRFDPGVQLDFPMSMN
jgi:hypothetical protein